MAQRKTAQKKIATGRIVSTWYGGGVLAQKTADLSYYPPRWFCVRKGQDVFTDRGYVKIEEIKEGDYVLTLKGNFSKVFVTSVRRVSEDIYKVKLSGGIVLELTYNHKVFVYNNGEIKEKFVYELDTNDYMIMPRCKEVKIVDDINEDIAYILGLYLAEGYIPKDYKYKRKKNFDNNDYVVCKICGKSFKRLAVHLKYKHNLSVEDYKRKYGGETTAGSVRKLLSDKAKELWDKDDYKERFWNGMKTSGFYPKEDRFILTLGVQDIKIKNRIEELSKKLGFKYRIFYGKNERNMVITIISDYITGIIRKYIRGKGACNKYLDNSLLFLPFNIQEKILEGYFNGDGWLNETGFGVSTCSERLSKQIRFILNRLGYRYGFRVREGNGGFSVGNSQYSIERIKNSDSNEIKIFDDFIIRKVKEIRTYHYEGEVYDLQVEDESYTVNDVAVHNSPLLSFVHFYVPWDRATLYQWIRYFDTWHPIVGAAIDIHVQMPLSRFSLRGITDPYVMRVYEQQLEELRAFLLMYDQLSEWWTIGEVFTMPYWDEELGLFTNAQVLMPEYVEIKSLPFLGSVSGETDLYYLVLDSFSLEALKSEDPDIQQIVDSIDPDIRDAIESRGKIKIDPNLLMIMMKRRHAYQNRAQPIILRVMKELIYESKLVEAMYTIAERHVNPKEIWRIGNDNFPADDSVLAAYESLIREAENQPLFTLVVPHVVSLDVVGATGKFPNLSNELDWVEKRILTALLLNKAVVHGEGPNFACYDEETEFLSEDGIWKKYYEWQKGEKVLAYDPYTGELKYEEPLVLWIYDYDGEMVKFKTNKIDLLVTPNHKMLAYYYEYDLKLIMYAEDFMNENIKNKEFGFYNVVIKEDNYSKELVKIMPVKDIVYKNYKGKVWSFTLPSGFFVVRRNGKVSIQGNTASVATRTLLMRYMEIRAMLEDEWINKIFLPVALKHNFLEITQAELDHGVRRPFSDRRPILPEFDWHYKMRLLDDSTFRDRIIELYKAGKVPAKILTDVLGIDYQYLKNWKAKEEGSILDPLYEDWRKALLKADIDAVPFPRGVKKSSFELDKKNYKQVLEEADRRNRIFVKYIESKEKKYGSMSADEREKFVKKIKAYFENKEFAFPTRGGLLRKLKIAEEILKKGNLDLAFLLDKIKKEDENED